MSTVRSVQVNVESNNLYDPNMRFGTSYISAYNRKYAVKHEVMMDKASGEIFLKRPIDGRVISFHQNKKYVNDLLMELRILLTNNPELTYPRESTTGFYFCMDYDLVGMNDEREINVLSSNTEIVDNRFQFNLSKDTNGFFIRVNTRDCDKGVMSYISNKYNSIFESYNGNDSSFLIEKNKFRTMEHWNDSDAILYYTLTIINESGDEQIHQLTANIHINEMVIIKYPDEIDISEACRISISITKIDYYKLHYMNETIERIGNIIDESVAEEYRREVNKFSVGDNKIVVNVTSIMGFVDNSTDITMRGYEFVLALMDIPFVQRYLMKISKLTSTSAMILSSEKPSVDLWQTNTVWIEPVRTLSPQNGIVTKRSGYSSFKSLESYIAANGITYGELSDNIDKDDDFVVIELSE